MDSQPDFPLVDEDHFSSLQYDLIFTSALIDEFLMAYKSELDSDDLEILNKLNHMKESLEETIEKNLPPSRNPARRYDNNWLTHFVSDFHFYFRVQLVYICKKYEKCKYCDYEIKYN